MKWRLSLDVLLPLLLSSPSSSADAFTSPATQLKQHSSATTYVSTITPRSLLFTSIVNVTEGVSLVQRGKKSKSPAKNGASRKSSQRNNGKAGVTMQNKMTTTKKHERKVIVNSDLRPDHWIDAGDEVMVALHETSGKASHVRFKVRGQPRALTRHRTARGITYNPSAHLQESFRDAVKDIFFRDSHPELCPPLFAEGQPLVVTLVFRMKRPQYHFVGSKRGLGRLKESIPSRVSITRTDVDNLTKFVFDSLNKVLYHDDSQIVSVHVIKILDDEGLCEGSTEMSVRLVGDGDVSTLLRNSFGILE